MITTLVRRVMPLAGLGVLLALVVRGQRVPQASADTWFHLRFGEEFLAGWSLRDPGHLGVFDNAEWLPTQWLSQVGMAWTQTHLGTAGLVWASGLLVLALAVLVYFSCRQQAAPLPATIATALALMAASPGLSARPQLFSYLFIALTTAAWLATASDGKPRYWIVILAWAWPMLHGMWPVGISISVVAVFGLALSRRYSTAALGRLAAIPVLSCVVALLNPLGISTVQSLFDVGDRAQFFAEWGPTDFTTPAAGALAVMLTVVVVAGLRSAPRTWVHTLLLTLGLAWGLYSMRTTPVAALIVAPLLSGALQSLVPDAGGPSRSEVFAVASMLLASCVALTVITMHRDAEETVPLWLDDRLDALPPGTQVLNDWALGSYLLFRHPSLNLVMHGYGDVFTDEELRRNADVSRLEPGWDRTIEKLQLDVALVDPDSALGYAVKSQLGWTEVQTDGDYSLFTAPPQGG